MTFFRQDKLTVMLSADDIRKRVKELGEDITREYASLGGELVLVGILKGSVVFMADLAREIDLPLSMDFIGLSSYGDETETSGVVRLTSDLSQPVDHKHVLVVEDIVDTGLTMRYLLDNLRTRSPATIKLASLLEKPTKNTSGVTVDYLGFTVPDKFVVGYGLDAAGKYRNLPFVAVMEP
jgi:hypoxanthine phosphoribosyltransferase